jgi:hypothetical protein
MARMVVAMRPRMVVEKCMFGWVMKVVRVSWRKSFSQELWGFIYWAVATRVGLRFRGAKYGKRGCLLAREGQVAVKQDRQSFESK